MSKYKDYRGSNQDKRRHSERTKMQADEDFEACCSMLQDNMTWAEIHAEISSYRDYPITLGALKQAYETKIKNIALQRAPELEKERLLEDIESLMYRCLVQFNASIGDVTTVEEKGWVEGSIIKKPYRIIKTMKQLGSTDFLNTYTKLLDRKIKLLGLDKTVVSLDFSNIEFDDSGGIKMKPINSEKDVE